MKKLLTAALLALPLLAGPARATNLLGPVHVDTGAEAHFTATFGQGCANGGCAYPASPWYTYWPYQAYFNTPAPVGGYPYPYLPAQATTQAAPAGTLPAAPQTAPVPESNAKRPLGFQPVVYYPDYADVPSYWYGQ